MCMQTLTASWPGLPSCVSQERKAAPVVYRALKAVEALYRELIGKSPAVSAAELRQRAMEVFGQVGHWSCSGAQRVWWPSEGVEVWNH